jgi:hypothetical protein
MAEKVDPLPIFEAAQKLSLRSPQPFKFLNDVNCLLPCRDLAMHPSRAGRDQGSHQGSSRNHAGMTDQKRT